jgi:fibronectin-binding autotransporter adhesin
MKALRLSLIALLGIATAEAQTSYTWTGGGANANWSTSANWAGATPVSNISTWLRFRGSTTTPATNDIANPFILNQLIFENLTGDFSVASSGPLQLNGSFASIQQDGSFTATIQAAIATSSNLTITGTGTGDLRLLSNYVHDTGEQLIINRAPGTLTVFDGGMNNSGLISVVAGTVQMHGLQNSGTIAAILNGRLVLGGTGATYTLGANSALTGTSNSTITIQDATVQIQGPSVTFATSSTLILANGTISGTNNINISAGQFLWTGGGFDGSAAGVTSVSIGTGTISGATVKNIDRNLAIGGGTLSWDGGDINLSPNVFFAPDLATFRITGTSGNITTSGTGYQLYLTSGTFTKASEGLNEIAVGILQGDSSTISASSGTLRLAQSGSYRGVISTSGSGIVEFAGGTHVLNGPATVRTSGTSAIRVASGTLAINSFGILQGGLILEDGAVLTGTTASLNFENTGQSTFQWNGGTIASPVGGHMTTNAITLISGTAAKSLDRRSLTLASGQWSGGDIALINESNLSITGSMGVTGDNALTRSGTLSRLFNSGFINKTTATGTTTLATPIVNSGTIRAENGTILLTGGGTSTGLIAAGSMGTIEFGSGNFQINSFDPLVGSNSGTNAGNFRITGGQVNINNASTLNLNAALTLAESGTLGGNSPSLTIQGTRFDWTGGVIVGTSSSFLTIQPATFISGTAAKTLSGRSLALTDGQWSGGDIQLDNFANLAVSGSLGVTSDNAITRSGTSSALFNNGLIHKTVATGTTTLAATIVNSGTIRAETGTILLTGGGTSSGLISASSLGTIEFAAGTYQIEGDTLQGFTAGPNSSNFRITGGRVNINNSGTLSLNSALTLTESGTLGGNAQSFTIQGTRFDWTGGVITGTTVSFLTMQPTTFISGTAIKTLDGRSLSLANGQWSGGDIQLSNSSNLFVTGSLGATNDNALTRSGTSNTLVNTGFIHKTNSTGTTTLGAAIVNSGTIRAETGTILLTGGGTSSGLIIATPFANIEFGGGTYQIEGDTLRGFISGTNMTNIRITAGQVGINNTGTFNMNSALTLAESGTLGGSSTFYVMQGNRFDWTGGVITGTTVSLLMVQPTTYISGTAAKTLTGRSLSLANGQWSGGDILMTNASDLTTSGSLGVTSDNAITRSGTIGRLTNNGYILKTIATGTTTLALPVLNTGTIRADTGTILLTGGGTSTGMLIAGPLGAIDFGGGTYQIHGDTLRGFISGPNLGNVRISSGRVNINDTGLLTFNSALTLADTGTLGGNTSLTLQGNRFNWTGGVITGTMGGFTTIQAATLISGTATKTVDGRLLSMGNGEWSGGDILFANFSNLSISGSMGVTGNNSLTRSGTFASLTNSGFINKTSTGTTTLATPLLNTGTIRAASGTILLTGGGTSTGFISAGFPGTIEFGGGIYDIQGDLLRGATSGTNSSNFRISSGLVNINNTNTLTLNSALILNESGTLNGNLQSLTLIGNRFEWTGGVIAGTAFSQFSVQAATFISGTATKTLDRRSLSMAGGVWSGGDIQLSNDSNLSISGSLGVTSNNTLARSGTSSVLTHSGYIHKTNSTGTTNLTLPLLNTGTIRADTGTIRLTGGGTSTGLFFAGTAGMIEFASGTYDLSGGAPLAGISTGPNSGVFQISGGRVNINGQNVTINQNARLTLADGATLGGEASFFNIAGPFNWTGGTITGTTNSFAFASNIAFSGTATKTLDGRSLSATGNWSGGDIALRNSTLTANNLTVLSDAKITRLTTAGGLVIAGSFFKGGTSGTTTFDTAFQNNGSIYVQSGALRFAQSGTNTGTISIANGATLDVDAAIAGTGTTSVAAGGTLTGSGTIGGAVTVSGTLAPGNSPGTMGFEGSLVMNNDSTYLFDLAAYQDDASGGLAGTDWDLLAFSGTAGLTFNPGSEIYVNFSGIGNPDSGNPFWDSETHLTWLIADLDSGTLNASNLSVANADWSTGTFRLYTEGNDLYLQFVIPEPTTATLLLLGLGLAARRQRRRGC